jgi:ATP sulfurylase
MSGERAKDLENIAVGIFSPLAGFVAEDDLTSVVKERRLASEILWTIIFDVGCGQGRVAPVEKPGNCKR